MPWIKGRWCVWCCWIFLQPLIQSTTLSSYRDFMTDLEYATQIWNGFTHTLQTAIRRWWWITLRVTFGIPQGSVLGPILFTLYTSPLGDLCRCDLVDFQQCADDQQVYLFFKPSHPNQTAQECCIGHLEKCIEDIKIWMYYTLLTLNYDKTEFLVFGTKQQLRKIDNITIQVGSETISPIEFLQNLGYFLDTLMKNAHHINKLTSQLYLSHIHSIRSHIDEDTAKIII